MPKMDKAYNRPDLGRLPFSITCLKKHPDHAPADRKLQSKASPVYVHLLSFVWIVQTKYVQEPNGEQRHQKHPGGDGLSAIRCIGVFDRDHDEACIHDEPNQKAQPFEDYGVCSKSEVDLPGHCPASMVSLYLAMSC